MGLHELNQGEVAVVTSLGQESSSERDLQCSLIEMGIAPGEQLKVFKQGNSNGRLYAIEIQNVMIGLSHQHAEVVQVQKEK